MNKSKTHERHRNRLGTFRNETFLDEYPLEKHVGEAIYGIYMRLIEAL